jgi:large subunit ribosomal protein L10
MNGETLSVEQIESIARLPGREQLHAQLVGVVASPLTTLVRGLASMISGLAIQLQQIQEQGLVGGEAPAPEPEAEAEPEESTANGEPRTASEDEPEPSDAPGDPVAEAEAAEQEETSEETSETQEEQE